ncbi:MAG TPA: alpha/beta hydrolase [Pedobacter sp.]|jgi:acetyl esterase/lipase
MYKSLIAAAGLLISMKTLAQEVRPLYTGKVPNSIVSSEPESKIISDGGYVRYSKVQVPTIEIYLPKKSKSTGAAVVIVPGGAYGFVSYTNEGTKVAKAFNDIGVAAFILKYRLPSDKSMVDKTIGPLQDAQQAIKAVRMGAKSWGIDTAKVGIIGFSAGGHLASTAGTHFHTPVIDNPEKINLRPSFMILVYPVISFNENLTHLGSRNNLIGMSPSPELIKLYSNELQVTAQTPPTMLVHTADDQTVKVENSLRFYEALLNCRVPAEMHLYPKGGHGFGAKNDHTPDKWMDRVENWLKAGNFNSKK